LRPYLEKNPSEKRAGGAAQGIGPEFKVPHTHTHTHKKPIEIDNSSMIILEKIIILTKYN
jgi:hypothetical protein